MTSLTPRRKKAAHAAKSAAQQAAEATIEAVPPVAEAPGPAAHRGQPIPERGPTKGRRQKARPQASQPQSDSGQQSHNAPLRPPNTGVEIISTEERNGQKFHTMRDLRDGTTVHNVTRKSARRLWYYAILQHEHGDPSYAEIAWHPNERNRPLAARTPRRRVAL